MIKNHLKIAWRNLKRQKGLSFINIIGLAIGLATCLLILLFVQNQLSYDRYNSKADQIVRVAFEGKMDGGTIREADVMPPVAKTFKDDFPEVLDATRIRTYGKPRITYKNTTFRNNTLAFVDANFFGIFTIPLLKGDKETALKNPNTIVLSKAAATQYFGHENAIGKTLELKGRDSAFEVTGIFDKIPDNSHFHFDMLASMATLPEAKKSSWMTSNFYTYMLLAKGSDYKKLEAKLPHEVKKYMGPQIQEAMGVPYSKFKESGNNIGFRLQPLTEIHLHSDLSAEIEPAGNIQYVYIFSAVAIFMLLIACINFMNLSTAGASKRAKEIGVRKALGSFKRQLVAQFLTESLLITVIAMLIALCMVDFTVPLFSDLAGQGLMTGWSSSLWLVPILGLFVIFIGVLAGSYPAFYLSSFNPLNVIKSRFYSGEKGIGLRKGLVVFQFFISISLILGTLVVYNQLSFIHHKKLGYDKDQVLVIEDTHWLDDNQDAFKNEVLNDSRVTNASYSGYLPAGPSNRNNFMVSPDGKPSTLVLTLRYGIDYNYIPTLDMHMVAGRNFSKAHSTDSLGIIINEAAVRALGWKQKAIGHHLTHVDNNGISATYHVIGVVKNFHFRSLHQLITPLVMNLENNRSNLIVKVKTAQTASLLTSLKTKWNAFTTESPFTYSFLNDRFNNTYKTEQNTGLILSIFAGLTIFVACLGLFGLVMFSVERRTKEIGIRKILGANIAGIVSLLSKDFLKLIGIAFLIAGPVAWYAMHQWLADFAYKITIGPGIFLLTGGLALLVALATVSWQSIRAALANPVDSLRSE